MSHRIQSLIVNGEGGSRLDTIDVGAELDGFTVDEGDEEREGLKVRSLMGEVVGGEGGGNGDLMIGLVYGGKDGKSDDEGVKECVENAIRGIYSEKQLSGWMELKSGSENDGEWVSYIVYRSEDEE